ncbi:MAG: DivIVA domain-containing protein, partial [Acidimicrobiales bacterium]
MPEDPSLVSISSQRGLHPDEIARRTFPSARRGVDAEAVRRFLETVAEELRQAGDREVLLRKRLAEAERRAEEPELDEQTLSKAVGLETGRILQAAHDAANEVVLRAE